MVAKKTRKSLVAAGLVLVNAFLGYHLALSWKEQRPLTGGLTFKRLFEGPTLFHVADLDNNTVEDVIAVSSDEPYPRKNILKCFCPFRPLGHHLVSYFFEDLVLVKQGVLPPVDLDGDGHLEIPLVEIMNGTDLIMRSKGLNGEEKGVYRFPLGGWEGYTAFDAALDDLDADGSLELVMTFRDYWNHGLRGFHGIAVFDIRNGRMLWDYRMGCQPLSMKVADINDDGRKEIIISGWAAHNGMSANGTDDDHSYVIVLSSEGKELWRRELGFYYTQIHFDVGDVDQDGQQEIITGKSCHRAFAPDPAELKIFDAATGREERHYAQGDNSFTGVHLVRGEGGKKMVLAGDSAGRVSLFDKELRRIRSVRYNAAATVLGAAILDQSTAGESIFVRIGSENLEILNMKLKSVRRETFRNVQSELPFEVKPIRNGSEHAVALMAGDFYLIRKEHIGIFRILGSLFRARFTALLLVVVVFNGLWLIDFRGGPRRREDSAQAGGVTDVIQEIAHRMKSPLFTIQLETERLQSALSEPVEPGALKDVRGAPKSILEDVASLKGKIRSMMKVLELREPVLKEADLNALVNRVVERYSGLLKNKITFELNLDKEAGVVPLDEEQMEEALANIVENAVDALAQGGKVRLATTAVYSHVLKKRRGMEVEIVDNGRGIPEDQIDKIFTPYFTTKKDGTGLGLTIARRIVEAHGGRVEAQSRMGVGTRVAIFLPGKGGKKEKKVG